MTKKKIAIKNNKENITILQVPFKPKELKELIHTEAGSMVDYYERGLNEGVKVERSRIDKRVMTQQAFDAGVRHIIEIAESNLASFLKLNNRLELSDNGNKIPSWWLSTLFSHIWYEPEKEGNNQ